MNRRKYISTLGAGSLLGLSTFSTRASKAELNSFNISNVSENNTVSLKSSSDDINGINLNFSKFKINTYYMSQIDKDIIIKFYARTENNNYTDEVESINVPLSKSSESIDNIVDYITITDNTLSGELPRVDGNSKKIYLKVEINHENFAEKETFETNINLEIEKENTELYGDGSDGEIIRSTSDTESGIIYSTRYTINDGVIINTDGTVIIHATDKITINGKIRAKSPTGSSGASPFGNNGNNGGNGLYISNGGNGGSGGPVNGNDNGESGELFGGGGGAGRGSCSGGNSGGDGGNGGGATSSIPSETQVNSIDASISLNQQDGWNNFYSLPTNIAAGGGGGGAGGYGESGGSSSYGDGGDGGDGGGLIILVAPEIEVNGEVSAAGMDGKEGQKKQDGSSCGRTGSGGAGAGGAGGLIYIISESTNQNGILTVKGGAGGIANDADGWADDGAEGADGRDGEIYNINVE
jgi:hypothetical protein